MPDLSALNVIDFVKDLEEDKVFEVNRDVGGGDFLGVSTVGFCTVLENCER